METPIRLVVMSPQETVCDVRADMVELPGVMGRFEVLKDHAPLITALTEGRIRYVSGGKEEFMGIRSGFVEVRDNKVTVCAEL